jgi:hypothetical protein
VLLIAAALFAPGALECASAPGATCPAGARQGAALECVSSIQLASVVRQAVCTYSWLYVVADGVDAMA